MKSNLWRLLISFIGLIMILYSLFLVSIGLLGTNTFGTITSYTRIMGERDEIIPNRYTYSLGYQFFVEEKVYGGSSTVIGSPLFIEPDGNSFVEIMYIEKIPNLNALKTDTSIDIGKFVLIVLGFILIYVMNTKLK